MAKYTIKSKVKKAHLAKALGVKSGLQVIFTNKAGGEEKFTVRITKMLPKQGQIDVCFGEADVESAEINGLVKIPFTKRTIPFLSAWAPNPRHPRKVTLEVSETGESYIHM